MIGLGIDAGGTATRWHLAGPGGRPVGAGASASLSGIVFTSDQQTAARETLAVLALDVLRHANPDRVLAGITGLDAGSQAAAFFATALGDALGLEVPQIQVENDLALSLRAATPAGGGILVYTGTGSVAGHRTSDGTLVRIGGRGVIIDDGGSAFWITREAVKALFRLEDAVPGSGFATVLGQHLSSGFGAPTWAAARSRIYGVDRGQVATLARHVGAAAHEGDPLALQILASAGRELAWHANTLLDRLGPRDVILSGRASTLHPGMVETFKDRIGPRASVRHVPELDSARAGALAAISRS